MGTMIDNQVPYSTPSVEGVAGQAKDVAANVASHTKELLSTELTTRTERSASELDNVANALRQTSVQLEGTTAQYMEKAAEQIERVSEYVRSANVKDIGRTVEDFARREPLLFLGGAFALGLLGARFLKSSAGRPDETPVETKSTGVP